MGREKSSEESGDSVGERSKSDALSRAWRLSCGVLCAVALLVLVAGCSSGPASTSGTFARSFTLASTTTTTPKEAASTPFPAPQGDKWGFIDSSGSWVIKAQFDKAEYFYEGLAPVQVGGKWGYVDQAGQLVIKPQYEAANYFRSGLALVATKTSEGYNGLTGYGWIDKTGKFVIPPTWDQAEEFFEGLAIVCSGTSFGYVDTKGNIAIPLKFQNAGSFSEGLAPAASGDKWGYIDQKGSWVIAPRYGYIPKNNVLVERRVFKLVTGVSQFRNGYAAVWDSGKNVINSGVCHFIDKTGKTVFGRSFQAAGDFSEGLATVQVNGKWGFIDVTGRMVIKPQFGQGVRAPNYLYEASGFREGLAVARNNEHKLGYIDKTGKWVIQPQYRAGSVFAYGLAFADATVSPREVPEEIIAKDGHVVYRNTLYLSTTTLYVD